MVGWWAPGQRCMQRMRQGAYHVPADAAAPQDKRGVSGWMACKLHSALLTQGFSRRA